MSEEEFKNFTTSIIMVSIENNNMIDKEMKNYCTNYILSLQQKVEQLEKENKRLKEWNEDLLSENIQLENIRKEAINFIDEELQENGSHNVSGSDLPYDVIEDLLIILNKGSDVS